MAQLTHCQVQSSIMVSYDCGRGVPAFKAFKLLETRLFVKVCIEETLKPLAIGIVTPNSQDKLGEVF